MAIQQLFETFIRIREVRDRSGPAWEFPAVDGISATICAYTLRRRIRALDSFCASSECGPRLNRADKAALARIHKARAGIEQRLRASERVLDRSAFEELENLLQVLDERIRKLGKYYDPHGC